MKKLMIAMTAASALAFCAKAADPLDEADFEDVSGVEYTIAGDLKWANSDEEKAVGDSVIKAYDTATETYGSKYLYIDNEEPLNRKVDATVDKTGVYIDSMVKFTAADTAPTTTDGDKLLIWLGDEDVTGTEGVKKFYVTAYDTVGTTNAVFETGITGTEDWCQLRVDATFTEGDERMAFTVKIDGADAGSYTSMDVTSEESAKTLASVGFQGSGAIDNYTYGENEGLTEATITLSGENFSATVDGADFTTGTLEPGAEISIAAATEKGYVITSVEGDCGKWDEESGVFTLDEAFTASAYTITVTTKLGDVTVDGVPYATLAAAFDAIAENGGTIKLASDITLVNDGGTTAGQMLDVASETTIDLNGKTISFTSGEGVDPDTAFLTIDSTLTITDSSEEQTGKMVAGEGLTLISNNGTLVVTGGTFDGNIIQNGELTADDYDVTVVDEDENIITIAKKSSPETETYTVTVNKPEAGVTVEGAPTEKVAAGDITLTVKAAAGYKNVVVKVGEETITGEDDQYTITIEADTEIDITVTAITYATLTITQVENCTITVKQGEDVVETGATFDVDDEVELTVTRAADEGYELDGCEATETIAMTENKTVTAAVKAKSAGETSWDNPKAESGTAKEMYGITRADLKDVDGTKLATWAKANNIDFATAADTIALDAFLLNVANDDDAINAAKAEFKCTSIMIDADGTVKVTTPDKTYNGTVTIYGSTKLSKEDNDWHPQADGDKFFKAVLGK